MDYVRLGSTGLEVSRLCLGCMTYGVSERGNHSWTLDEDRSRPLIREAIEAASIFSTRPTRIRTAPPKRSWAARCATSRSATTS